MNKKSEMNHFELWIFGWCQILDGFTSILSFGYLNLSLPYKYIKYLSHKHFDYNDC